MRNVLLIIALHVFTSLFATDKTVLTVVLDPGHGGKDPGAIRTNYKEKNITLGVALELGKLIEKDLKDVNVVYTRKTDVFVGLKQRAEIANKANANAKLFVSIHVNSSKAINTTAHGAETYILGTKKQAENIDVIKQENAVITLEEDYMNNYDGYDPDDDSSYIMFQFISEQFMSQSFDVANSIQKSFVNIAKRSNRGVKQGGLLVLKSTSMPAVLIELGFINNLAEAKYLSSTKGQKDMAKSIFEGIKEYRNNVIKKNAVLTNNTQNTTLAKNTNTTQKGKTESPQKKQDKTESISKDQIKKIDTTTDPYYTIQFLYSSQKQRKNSSAFRGITPTAVKEENGYKYMVGEETDYAKIVSLHKEVKKKFPDAFIIKLNEEEREAEIIKSEETTPKASVDKKNNASKEVKASLTTKKDTPSEIEYRVQFLTSPKELRKDATQFNGIENIKFYKDGNSYKYTSGSFKTLREAANHQTKIRKKYKDAFVVKFKDNRRL